MNAFVCLCVYLFPCVYVCVSVWTEVSVCTCVCLHGDPDACMSVCECLLRVDASLCVLVYLCACLHRGPEASMCVYIYVYMCTWYMYMVLRRSHTAEVG